MSHHSQNSEIEAEVRHEQAKRLSHFYEHHQVPLIFRPIYALFHHYPAFEPLDLSNYQHPTLDSFSQRQIVDRTVFALQKIKAHNHHFFNQKEQRILDPLPLGVITYSIWFGGAAFSSFYFMYLWKNWSFTPRSVGVLAALAVLFRVEAEVPNFLCEKVIQGPRRRALARRYLKQYGAEFFHDVIDPRYDTHRLHNLGHHGHGH